MATFDGADREYDALEPAPYAPSAGADREWIVVTILDTVAPVVANAVPALNSVIARSTPVDFDVTDNLGSFTRVIVLVEYPSGVYEVAHDGDAFAVAFAALSTRTVIANGYHFTLQRTGYWLESPTIRVIAIDSNGNESV